MRTKTLLLVAAVSAAGLASSMAQVYSVNVVGYVNQVMTNKNTLIANPFLTTNDTLQGVLSGALPGSTFFRFKADGTGYQSTFKPAGTWLSNFVFKAGNNGGFLQQPGAGPYNFTNTYVGEVYQGALSTPFGATFSTLLSSKVPQSGTPEVLGLTSNIVGQATIFRWRDNGLGYQSFFKPAASSSFLASPTLNIATSFFLQSTNASAWNRNFTVGP